MNKNKDSRIEDCEQLNILLLRQKSYLNIVKGYCENAMHNSEEAADIYTMIEKIRELHEKISDDIDNLIISIGC